MRKAFTLIEVMISVAIIVTMSLGIFQMQVSNTKQLTLLNEESHMSLYASSMLSQPNPKDHQKTQSFYDFLKNRYPIDYDPLIKELKKERVTFKQKEAGRIILDLLKADGYSTNPNNPKEMGLLIKRNTLSKKTKSAQTLTFELMQ